MTVPICTPKDTADLVVFRDDAQMSPFTVIESKRDGVTYVEFSQAVKQACVSDTGWQSTLLLTTIIHLRGGYREPQSQFS